MSIRNCCYKDCKNFNFNNKSDGNFTLFQFPKDPERRKQWMQLGLVNPHIPANSLFMCSDHFERGKYMSVNPRRTVLIGAAVPYAYVNKTQLTSDADAVYDSRESCDENEEVTCTEGGNTYMLFDDDVEIADIQEHTEIVEEYPAESTIEDVDSEEVENKLFEYRDIALDKSIHNVDDEVLENNYSVAKPLVLKKDALKIGDKLLFPSKKRRKITEPSVQINQTVALSSKPKPSNNIKTKSLQVIKAKSSAPVYKEVTVLQSEGGMLPDGNNAAHIEIDQSSLIDAQHVTTFIFKGEEYVQMPKDFYLHEKLELLQKLNNYENALRTIKQNVNAFDLS